MFTWKCGAECAFPKLFTFISDLHLFCFSLSLKTELDLDGPDANQKLTNFASSTLKDFLI